MVYSTDQQPIEDLRENLHTEQVKYEQAIKEGKPLKEAKKIFSVVKEIRKKLLDTKSEVRRPKSEA
jgi:hypothetical protein